MSKKSKSKAKRSRALSSEHAVSILEQMAVPDRVQAVWEDVESGQRRFANVDTFALANLLDVPQPESPTGDWCFERAAEIRSLQEYHEEGRLDDLAYRLEGIVPASRLEAIRADCAACDAGERADFDFLKPDERRKLAEQVAREELEAMTMNGMGCMASYCVRASGVELWFHADIEDDGSCISLQGPYDGVEGPSASEDDDGYVSESW